MDSTRKSRRPEASGPGSGESDPASPTASSPAAAAELVRELILQSGAAALPARIAEHILALGEAAIEPLIEVLVDSRLRDPKGPAAGWAPVHAARLLGLRPRARAIEPLLDVLATTDKLSPLGEAVSKALVPLKAQLVTPILERLPTAVGGYRRELWYLLAGAGVREPRIFVQLLAALSESPEVGAMCLSEYGDRAALPDLAHALDAHPLGLADEPVNDHAVFELREAILELGGVLTAEQQAKYERALWTRRVRAAAEPSARRPSSPDAPCSCGSGRRYRHCCLQ